MIFQATSDVESFGSSWISDCKTLTKLFSSGVLQT